ncbi:MAG: hypothetical protein LBG69_04765 [Zoogloeaceae bacterium]|nr:hypothetical protein [Zoogloeaceae bacterium]
MISAHDDLPVLTEVVHPDRLPEAVAPPPVVKPFVEPPVSVKPAAPPAAEKPAESPVSAKPAAQDSSADKELMFFRRHVLELLRQRLSAEIPTLVEAALQNALPAIEREIRAGLEESALDALNTFLPPRA